MQYISLTMRKMKYLVLLFSMVVMPNIGFCQNAPQKDKVVRYVNSTHPIDGTLSTKSENTDSVNSFLSIKNINSTLTPNDTILSSIQDTLNRIAGQTEPKKFLFWEATKTSGTIGLLALIAGIAAALYARSGYKYQKKSAKSLEDMQAKRLPFMLFAKRIFDNILTLDILTEIEHSKDKVKMRKGYQIDKAIDELRMPDDLIDLKCYEYFDNNEIYNSAINLIISWRTYNKNIDNLCECYSKSNWSEIPDIYKLVREKTIRLLHELFDFENLIMGYSKEDFFGCDPEDYVTEEAAINQIKSGCDVPNTIIGARKIFSYQMFSDFRKSLEYCSREKSSDGYLALYDPRIYKNDISAIKLDVTFPIPDNIYVRKNPIVDKVHRIFAKEDAQGIEEITNIHKNVSELWGIINFAELQRDREKEIIEEENGNDGSEDTYGTMSIDEAISESIQNKNYTSIFVGDTKTTTIKNGEKEVKYDIRRALLSEYNYNAYHRKFHNFPILLRMIYATKLAQRRKEMIEDPVFLNSETEKYTSERKRYGLFDMYNLEEGKCATISNAINAIVAEQTTDFDVMELNVFGGIKKYNIVKANACIFIPTLEKCGILKEGTFAISTFQELNDIIEKDNTIEWNYPLDYPEMLKKMNASYNVYLRDNAKEKSSPSKKKVQKSQRRFG